MLEQIEHQRVALLQLPCALHACCMQASTSNQNLGASVQGLPSLCAPKGSNVYHRTEQHCASHDIVRPVLHAQVLIVGQRL